MYACVCAWVEFYVLLAWDACGAAGVPRSGPPGVASNSGAHPTATVHGSDAATDDHEVEDEGDEPEDEEADEDEDEGGDQEDRDVDVVEEPGRSDQPHAFKVTARGKKIVRAQASKEALESIVSVTGVTNAAEVLRLGDALRNIGALRCCSNVPLCAHAGLGDVCMLCRSGKGPRDTGHTAKAQSDWH
jgi:hypothetical protein